MSPEDTGGLWHMGNAIVWLLSLILLLLYKYMFYYPNVKIRKANNGVNQNLLFEQIKYFIPLKPQHIIQ